MKFLKNYQNAFKGRPCVHIFSTIEDDCIICNKLLVKHSENEVDQCYSALMEREKCCNYLVWGR